MERFVESGVMSGNDCAGSVVRTGVHVCKGRWNPVEDDILDFFNWQ